MTTVFTVRSKYPRRFTLLLIQGWATGLAFARGRSPQTTVLLGNVAASVLEENHKDFMAKSASLSDRWGAEWRPLAPSTIARKLRKMRNDLGKRDATRFKKLVAKFSKLSAPGISAVQARQIAVKRAWVALRGADPRVPINIDTGRLQESLRPSSSLRTTLMPRTDQVVGTVPTYPRHLRIQTLVPYARYVNRVRPIYPTKQAAVAYVAKGVRQAAIPLVQMLGEKLS